MVNESERPLGKGQATREMCSGVKGRSEPVPEPPDGVARVKNIPLNLNRCDTLWRVPLVRGSPVYQFCLCNRKRDAQAARLYFKFLQQFLEPADVATIGDGGYCVLCLGCFFAFFFVIMRYLF